MLMSVCRWTDLEKIDDAWTVRRSHLLSLAEEGVVVSVAVVQVA